MPEISVFFGIVISMFADDHNPPHFHIRYGDYEAIVTIDGAIVKGNMPGKVLKRVFAWMDEHHAELHENWNRLQNGQEAQRIAPYKK